MPAHPSGGDTHPELPVDPDPVPAPHRHVGLMLVVAAGGAIGASLRYVVAEALPGGTQRWPTGTFVINLAGAFLLGLLLEGLVRLGPDSGRWRVARLGLGTGLLGAFTTYSTLADEAVLLGRDGRPGLALGYALASALGGFGAAAGGIALAAGSHALVAGQTDLDAPGPLP